MKKVTMQDIADTLNISRVSVWKVLNEHAGVSDELVEQVMSAANELGYFKNSRRTIPLTNTSTKLMSSVPTNSSITLSVVVSRPESSTFWMNIIHQIAKDLGEYSIDLMYTYLPSKLNNDYSLPKSLTNGSIDGIIVLNVYDTPLLEEINKLIIPKVYLDMVPSINLNQLSGDLILLEGKHATKDITTSLIQSGLTDIGFIGDINYAVTNLDRFYGFEEAMNSYNLKINKKHCLTKTLGIESYKSEIYEFLDQLDSFPEAFVCVSDFVANFVIQYCKEHNINIPNQLRISGFDGNNEYPYTQGSFTTVEVDTKNLGKRLTSQILYRIRNNDVAYEITYLKSNIKLRSSTE